MLGMARVKVVPSTVEEGCTSKALCMWGLRREVKGMVRRMRVVRRVAYLVEVGGEGCTTEVLCM